MTGLDFACGCSEKSRIEAEGWAREVFPNLREGEERIGTGEFVTKTIIPQVKQDDGTWAPGEPQDHTWEEPKEPTLTELALFTLADLGDELKMSFYTSIATDQWCGLSVVGKPWASSKDEDTWESYGCQFDWAMLGHALCAAILQIRHEHPECKYCGKALTSVSEITPEETVAQFRTAHVPFNVKWFHRDMKEAVDCTMNHRKNIVLAPEPEE